MIDANDVDPMPDADPDTGFWSQRESHPHPPLRPIPQRVPYAVLNCVLRRAIGCVEPHVKLRPIIGGTVSTNLYTIGGPYQGKAKDAADSAGSDAVYFPDATATTGTPTAPASAQVMVWPDCSAEAKANPPSPAHT